MGLNIELLLNKNLTSLASNDIIISIKIITMNTVSVTINGLTYVIPSAKLNELVSWLSANKATSGPSEQVNTLGNQVLINE